MASIRWTHRIATSPADMPVPVKTAEAGKTISTDTSAETACRTRSKIRANLQEVRRGRECGKQEQAQEQGGQRRRTNLAKASAAFGGGGVPDEFDRQPEPAPPETTPPGETSQEEASTETAGTE